jgi:hypothetical protein
MSKFFIKNNLEGLIAPPSFWTADNNDLEAQLNGCGPSKLPSWFVPDSFLGLSVKNSCLIHDWMYYKAKSRKDFKEADEVFFENLNKQIDEKKDFLSVARKAFSYIYFSAVRVYSNLKYNWLGS